MEFDDTDLCTKLVGQLDLQQYWPITKLSLHKARTNFSLFPKPSLYIFYCNAILFFLLLKYEFWSFCLIRFVFCTNVVYKPKARERSNCKAAPRREFFALHYGVLPFLPRFCESAVHTDALCGKRAELSTVGTSNNYCALYG
jgi:hypothetical protein